MLLHHKKRRLSQSRLRNHPRNKSGCSIGGHVLRLVLIAALLWLPMGSLSARTLASGNGAASTQHAMGNAAKHQHHVAIQRIASAGLSMADKMPDGCVGHQAPCCSACVTYCTSPETALTLPMFFSGERYQNYSVPISAVVMALDIRPPIV